MQPQQTFMSYKQATIDGHVPSACRTHLVVVSGHPGEQDEGAPVVAEVAQNECPHCALGQNELPRNFVGC